MEDIKNTDLRETLSMYIKAQDALFESTMKVFKDFDEYVKNMYSADNSNKKDESK